MTTDRHSKNEIESDSTDHTSATKRVLVVCQDCGSPYTARYIADGSMQLVGSENCQSCGGTDFRELTAEEVVGKPADDDADPEQEPPSPR